MYLPALTGVRAIAAFLVFIHHFNPFQKGEGVSGFFYKVANEFHIGVSLFFVLSGFLIALRYYGTQQWSVAWWQQYLRNRVARIYPMYFLITTLTFATLWYQGGSSILPMWLINITFLRGFFDDYKYSGIGQGWTLTVEECFYLFAPMAFSLLYYRPRLLWLIPFLVLGIGALLVLVLGPFNIHGLFGNFRFMLLYTFFGRVIEFFAGIQLALWYRRGLIPAGRGFRFTLAGLAVIAACLLGMVAVQPPDSYGQYTPTGIVLNNVVLPSGVVLLYVGILTESTWLRRLLSTPLFQLLGKSSYVFYLIHIGVIQVLITEFITRDRVLQFILLNLVAIAMFRFLEEPINRWLRAPSKTAKA